MYFCGFVTDCQIGRLLGSYFYVIGISYDKTHFTYIWVNLSRFKMIILSGYIEDMKITQELLKKIWIYKSRYLSRFIKARNLSQYLSIYQAYRIFDIACNVLVLKGSLFMDLYNSYKTRKAQGLCKPN